MRSSVPCDRGGVQSSDGAQEGEYNYYENDQAADVCRMLVGIGLPNM